MISRVLISNLLGYVLILRPTWIARLVKVEH